MTGFSRGPCRSSAIAEVVGRGSIECGGNLQRFNDIVKRRTIKETTHMKPIISIRTIGALQEDWQEQAQALFIKRLSAFSTISISEGREGHQGSAKPDLEKTKDREADELLKVIPRDAYVICLDEHAKTMDSATFSKAIENWSESGARPITFLIGGSWGLSQRVKQQAHTSLSLSPMTMPHALARIVLIEQLYRALTIIKGKEYHK